MLNSSLGIFVRTRPLDVGHALIAASAASEHHGYSIITHMCVSSLPLVCPVAPSSSSSENPHKVRTAKAERRTYGRFFFRFPNGEAGLDVYNRASSFLATLSRDIRQIDERYSLLHHDRPAGDAMAAMNILVVTHGLTLRLILMRYFQLSVEEFENSYNSQNARLVVMDRMVDSAGREYYRLHETAKEALNFMGDVSNEKPVYWRHDVAGGVGDGLFTMKDDDVEE